VGNPDPVSEGQIIADSLFCEPTRVVSVFHSKHAPRNGKEALNGNLNPESLRRRGKTVIYMIAAMHNLAQYAACCEKTGLSDVRILSFAGCFLPPDVVFHWFRSLPEPVSGLLTVRRLFPNPRSETAVVLRLFLHIPNFCFLSHLNCL
jgi:hypothetical protein